MSAVKNYFKQEVQWTMLSLQHPKSADFSVSAWQTTRSAAPLLFLRALLFLTSLGIVLASAIIYIQSGLFRYWFIYLTHWGLVSITLATGFSTLVSARCFFIGPISAEFVLPWYVKTYWILFNIATPLAFLITIFYWSLLYEEGIEEELNHGLDVAVHGLNSIVMFVLLVTSSHPSRLLHIYQPLALAMCYVIFGVIYYFAGGTDQKGNPWIYSVVNWANPGTTLLIVFVTGLLLVFLHLLTMGISVGRDSASRRWIKKPVPTNQQEVPLRQPAHTNV